MGIELPLLGAPNSFDLFCIRWFRYLVSQSAKGVFDIFFRTPYAKPTRMSLLENRTRYSLVRGL